MYVHILGTDNSCDGHLDVIGWDGGDSCVLRGMKTFSLVQMANVSCAMPHSKCCKQTYTGCQYALSVENKATVGCGEVRCGVVRYGKIRCVCVRM